MNAYKVSVPQSGSRSPLSHVDPSGSVRMVDVSGKASSVREARAEGWLIASQSTMDQCHDGSPKGNVLTTAEIAGIMAARQTSVLIPMCHPLLLDHVAVKITPYRQKGFYIQTQVRATGRTGVEMEAITATSVSAITLYDMLKSVQKDLVITEIKLLSKKGGRSGLWQAKTSSSTNA